MYDYLTDEHTRHRKIFVLELVNPLVKPRNVIGLLQDTVSLFVATEDATIR